MELRPYQIKAVEAVEAEFSKGIRSTLIVLATGCHAKGEKVLLSCGRPVNVEDVKIGDSLLAENGYRKVLALHHGTDEMFRIVPVKGDPFVVNGNHVLSLRRTSDLARYSKLPKILDITVNDYLKLTKDAKHLYKLYRSERVKFDCAYKGEFDPYLVGLLLGDGSLKNSVQITTPDHEVRDYCREWCERNGMSLKFSHHDGKASTFSFIGHREGRGGTKIRKMLIGLGIDRTTSENKFVPDCIKYGDIDTRREAVAGLIDTDGYLNKSKGYDYVSKSKTLANDLAFMCRSLGLAAYVNECRKCCYNNGVWGTYYRVSISGHIETIPAKVQRRKGGVRLQKKNVLRTGFSVERIGRGEYFGFTVDGDNRYLMGDFTVTHNCGKTIVFSNLAAREVRRGGHVLILAHRGELLDQAIDKLYKATGIRAGLEKAEQTSDVTLDDLPFTVVVGSVQSMKSEKRLARFAPNEFSLIVIDECHHALAETYKAVIEHFPGANLLGVTATPDRGDLRSLSEVFKTIAFEYSIIDAIRDGYLCPIHAQTVPLRIDIRGVSKQAGDYQAAGLGAALAPYLHQICREIKARCTNRKTIVFTPLISISREMQGVFASEGVTEVREVNGDSDDRKETLGWFAKAKPGCVLLNSMLLTEGYDEPSVDCIVVLRATKVRALFVQMTGRGTRLSPETGKKNLLLLDFLWLTAQHDLCRPACLLSEDPNVCETITRRTEKKTGADEELDLTPELVEDAESEFTRKCKDTLAKRLEAQSHKKGRLFDALQFAALTGTTDLANVPTTLQESDRPTLEQVDRLEKLGFACPGSSTAAEKLLNAYQQRVDSGLSTAKQIRFLTSRGFVNVKDWKLADAERMIRRIAACGWNRLPSGINPATYVP